MSRFEKWLLWTSTGVTFVTGAGFFWAKYLLTPATEWAVVNHPLQPWFLRLHILAAPVLVFALGSVMTRHARQQYRAGQVNGRRTGMVTGTCAGLMVVTGYLVQVITHVSWLAAIAYAHIGVGTVYVLVFATHEVMAALRERGFLRRASRMTRRGERVSRADPPPSVVGRKSTARASAV